MAAPKKFRLRSRERADGELTWYARFTDQNGRRQELALGKTPAMSEQQAMKELAYIQSDVERGTWLSPKMAPRPTISFEEVSFEEVAYDWWHNKIAGQKAVRTQRAYGHELAHVKRAFDGRLVVSLTKRDVDEFRKAQLDRGLAPAYVNSQIDRIAQILDFAMDWHEGVLPFNPARGKGRKADKGENSADEARWLDADHVELLLHAARILDIGKTHTRKHPVSGKNFAIGPRRAYTKLGRETIIATLAFAGLRASELCDLQWSHISFERRTIYVPGTKTDQAPRYVNIVDGLLPLLLAHREISPHDLQTDFVFPTATGKRRDHNNLRQRIVEPVVDQARLLIAEDAVKAAATGAPRDIDVALPTELTPHTFRRTFCGFCTEVERDFHYVRAQMGHADPRFTQRIYNIVRMWDGAPDPRMLAWMQRTKPEARASRLRLVTEPSDAAPQNSTPSK